MKTKLFAAALIVMTAIGSTFASSAIANDHGTAGASCTCADCSSCCGASCDDCSMNCCSAE